MGRYSFKVIPNGNGFMIIFVDAEQKRQLADVVFVKGPGFFTRIFRSKWFVQEERKKAYAEAQRLGQKIFDEEYS